MRILRRYYSEISVRFQSASNEVPIILRGIQEAYNGILIHYACALCRRLRRVMVNAATAAKISIIHGSPIGDSSDLLPGSLGLIKPFLRLDIPSGLLPAKEVLDSLGKLLLNGCCTMDWCAV